MSTGLLHVVYMIKKTRIVFVKDEGKKASHKVIKFFLLMQVVLFLIFRAFESIEMCLNVMR